MIRRSFSSVCLAPREPPRDGLSVVRQTQKNLLTIWDLDPKYSRQRQSGHATGAAKTAEKPLFHSFATPSSLA